jgi:type IV fimbrial biogenesis protein FimT
MMLRTAATGRIERDNMNRRCANRSHSGFTVVELMVVVAILAIVATLAAPSFSEAILNGRLTSLANNFLVSAQLARSEAIKQNAAATLCRSADGATCATSGTWSQGWIVTVGGTVIRIEPALPTDFSLAWTTNFDFQPGGDVVAASASLPVTLKLCRIPPSSSGQDRQIRITGTGRTSITRTATGTCP